MDSIPYLLSDSITLERDGCTFSGKFPGQYDDSIPGFNPNVNTPVSFNVSGSGITGNLLGLGLSGSTSDWIVTGSQQ